MVASEIFCSHGGLGPGLATVDQINRLIRPLKSFQVFTWPSDLMWSDPSDKIARWERQNSPQTNPHHRGAGHLFGAQVTVEFLNRNNLSMIARAHECVENGFRWHFRNQLVTIFSAPSYCEDNPGRIMKVAKDGRVLGFLKI